MGTEYLPPASNLRGAIADNPGMSLPRAIVPGRRYMITRRCSERRFFMRPGRETNNAFIYCLALAARKTGRGTRSLPLAVPDRGVLDRIGVVTHDVAGPAGDQPAG